MTSTVAGISLPEIGGPSNLPLQEGTQDEEEGGVSEDANAISLPPGTVLFPGEALSTLGDPLLSSDPFSGETDDDDILDEQPDCRACCSSIVLFFLLIFCPFLLLARTMRRLRLGCCGTHLRERGSRQARALNDPFPVMIVFTMVLAAHILLVIVAPMPFVFSALGMIFFLALITFRTRTHVRRIHHIEGHWCTDLLVTVFCFHASLWQMAQSVRGRSAASTTADSQPRRALYDELERTQYPHHDEHESALDIQV